MYFKTVQCMLSHFTRVWLCNPMDCSHRGARLLCPWDSPGKNIGTGCHALLQGILLTQVSNLCLLHLPALVGGFFTTSITWEAPSKGNYTFACSYHKRISFYHFVRCGDWSEGGTSFTASSLQIKSQFFLRRLGTLLTWPYFWKLRNDWCESNDNVLNSFKNWRR